MEIAHLIGMANQIAEFFEALPDRSEAVKGVAQHLRNFWAPGMRKQLIVYVVNGADNTLNPLAREAALMLHAELAGKAAR
jgi:formate dehydrogenase subunit delta